MMAGTWVDGGEEVEMRASQELSTVQQPGSPETPEHPQLTNRPMSPRHTSLWHILLL